jgi:prolyl-tRNA editing enzyme YbaK/EbsC (Cys-tRNA(Pro) deacylase)
MSAKHVKACFSDNACNYDTDEFAASTATVELAARPVAVAPVLITETLAFKHQDRAVLVVTKGDPPNRPPENQAPVSMNAIMVSAEQVLRYREPCWRGLPLRFRRSPEVYPDERVKQSQKIFLAAGSCHSRRRSFSSYQKNQRRPIYLRIVGLVGWHCDAARPNFFPMSPILPKWGHGRTIATLAILTGT